MRRWLTSNCRMPCWLTLGIIVLAAAAFVLPYAQTNALLNRAQELGVALRECEAARRGGMLIIDFLPWPFWGALANFPLVLAGLLCTLLAIAGAAWSLRRGRCSAGTHSQLPVTDRFSVPPG